MLPHSHFIAFNDIRSKYFSNALRDSSLYVTSSIRQLVAEELDDNSIHVLYARKSCRPTSGVNVVEQSSCSASIEFVLVYIKNVQM